MSTPRGQPLFLARSSYRQRRLRDALRLLPLAGAILLVLPLLWPRGAEGPGTAVVLIYLFGVWGLLIALTFALSRRLRTDETPVPPTGDAP